MLMISGMAAQTMSLFWVGVLIGAVFFIVGGVPWCRQHENMWLFVLTAIGSVPINITLTHDIIDMGILETGFPIFGVVVTSVEVYLLLLGMQELAIGVLGRMLWKKQRTMDEVIYGKEG